jgi:diguanylate cyclase (GGDEF)-like protein
MVVEVKGAPEEPAVGAEALRRAAQALGRSLRTDDLVFRYGPSRFVLLLEGMPPEALALMAERLTRLVPELIAASGLGLHTGVASGPGGMHDFATLLRRAEAGLRSRVVEAGDAYPVPGARIV